MLRTPLTEKIEQIHSDLKTRFDQLCRISIAVYDASSDSLKTFAHSTDGPSPLLCYEAKLSAVPTLKQPADQQGHRVLQDISVLADNPSYHSQQLLAAGYRSSYTQPLIIENRLMGFLFSNSREPGYFCDSLINTLAERAVNIAAIIALQFASIRTLHGALATVREFSRHRDDETANHVERMAHYSRIIGTTLAAQEGLSDEEIEYLYRFAPLHDIGKIAIPDQILLKPGKLDEAEFAIMKTHVDRGREMAELLIKEFHLGDLSHISMMSNIIAYHHERYDGEGYPEGLQGTQIPLEARIVKVADVFDALTSERPYKRAWPASDAFGFLEQHAGTMFDPDCVAAAQENARAFAAVRASLNNDALIA